MMKTQISFLPYTACPVQIYREFCQRDGRLNTLMLESADVHTKAGQKSFLMVNASLKFRAQKEGVIVEALTPLGEWQLENLSLISSLPILSQSSSKIVFSLASAHGNESLSEHLRRHSALDVLRDVIKIHEIVPGLNPEHFLVAGIFSYDLIDHFEELPLPLSDPHEFADYVFWLPETFIIVDHINLRTQVVQHYLNSCNAVDVSGFGRAPLPLSESSHAGELEFTSDISDSEYSQLVSKLKERVVAGDVFQIVPSRTFKMPCTNSLLTYEHLKAINPSPYMYYVVDESFELCGASPETFIKLDAKSRLIDVKPIAGTRRRGFDATGQIDVELDGRLEAELRLDTKELAEHMMLVDLARNDIARVSQLGTRHVERLLSVERFSHVMHLVSQVRGKLREGLDGLHAYQASMNMGTLVGAPKIKAAQILRRHEVSKRATYGGAIGYLDAAGNFDTAIIIRSAFIKNGHAYVRAGAGVVYDSLPLEEMMETKSKAMAVLRAIHSANAQEKHSS